MEHTVRSIAEKYVRDLLNKGDTVILGISGPQGSGKSTLAGHLANVIGQSHRVVQFSVDDFYLPHAQMKQVAETNGSLWSGRGLPGTHEVPMLMDILDQLLNPISLTLRIPRYDKSAFNGEGDRLDQSNWQMINLSNPPDLIILEGWFVGFESFDSNSQVLDKWQEVRGKLSYNDEQITQLNNYLKDYQQVWSKLTNLFAIRGDLQNIYTWRAKQEHALIAQSGSGMSDEQIISFVDRYMPAYLLFNNRMKSDKEVTINIQWEVVEKCGKL